MFGVGPLELIALAVVVLSVFLIILFVVHLANRKKGGNVKSGSFCVKCGCQNSADSAFCTSCGVKIERASVTENKKISSPVVAHGQFEFRGTGGSFLWLSIWTIVLTILTAGLFFPWSYCAQQKWFAERTFVNGKQLCFKGTGTGFFGTYLLILLFMVLTLGIYAPWGVCRLKRWQTNNLYFVGIADIEK